MPRRVLLAAAWLAAAVVLALGAAGIVAALDHLPDGPGRPELTTAADHAVAPALEAASADVQALADAVAALGEKGRTALAALVAGDTAALQVAVDGGTAQLDAIDAAAATLRDAVAAIPLAGPDRVTRYSMTTIARYEALAGAAAAVESLRPTWKRFAAGVVPAVDLTSRLLDHDRIAGEAIRLGGAGSYRQAVARIKAASAQLAAARTIRDQLATTVDVGTLDEWIARNAAYDDALGALWSALLASKGRVTDAVRQAADRERLLKDQLPPDARALVVILADVARGGLNQAVIAVEEARGQVLDAYAASLAPPSYLPVGPTAAPALPTAVPASPAATPGGPGSTPGGTSSPASPASSP